MARSDATAEEVRNDWLPLLDEELARLPKKYRLPIVLCDLEGKTRHEAAEQLGWPEGTVAGRLARARTMLAKALVRHGVVFSGGALAVAISQNTASACVPGSLLFSTVKAATMSAAGKAVAGVVSTKVAALTEGVMKAMFLTNLKTMTAMLLVVSMIAFGAGLLVHHTAAGQQIEAEENADKPPNRQAAPPQEEAVKPTPNVADGVKAKEDTGQPIFSLLGHKERLTSVVYSRDGRWIATAAWDGTARIWDAKTGKEVRRLDVPATRDYDPARLSQVMFSPDNRLIAACLVNEVVIIWDRETGEKAREFPGGSAAFAPDGKHIACGGRFGGGIRLHEVATGKMVREMRGPGANVESLTFSADGKTLVSEGRVFRSPRGEERDLSGLVSVWDVATGKQRQSGLEAMKHSHVVLAPDGRTIAGVGVAGSKSITLRETATSGQRAELTGHTDYVCRIAFSPDGRTLASTSTDKTLRLWDLPSGKEIGRLECHRDWVPVAFSPDGGALVSVGADNSALVWDVSKITRRRGESVERSSAELEAAWKDLGGDAAKGYAALGGLVSSPKQAVPFLGKQLQSAKAPIPSELSD